MPFYEYKCKCGNTFEELFSMSQDSSTAVCPKCGSFADKDFAGSMKGQHGYVFESFYHKGFGVTINSKEQLRRECKERDCISPFLEGSGRDIDGDKVEVKPWRDRPRKKFVEMKHG